ncbi:MAG TPA: DUF2059 domain-containing protein [Kiloniellaceae bacterium]|nr:DUF2059 domain-containing protein [Kiloniellaceae bacterium]HIP79850.1 DUF2059 domain-containing protein [Kiloniellaceae bacterium]
MLSLKRFVCVLVVALAATSAAGAAWAQSTKAEKAREVFQVFQGDGLMEQVFEATFAQINAMAKQANPEIPNRVSEIIQEEILAALKESMPLLIDEMAIIYERTFTEEELDAMLVFYKSPVGQSMIKKMPAMMAETVPLSQRWGMALVQNLPSRVEERLRSEGYEL